MSDQAAMTKRKMAAIIFATMRPPGQWKWILMDGGPAIESADCYKHDWSALRAARRWAKGHGIEVENG